MTVTILSTTERNIHGSLLEITAISDICGEKKIYWINQVKTTHSELKKIQDMDGNPILFSPREVIGLTIIKLYPAESRLSKEIDMLEYQKSIEQKFVYKKLKEMVIEFDMIRGPAKGGLFIILSKLSEENNIF